MEILQTVNFAQKYEFLYQHGVQIEYILKPRTAKSVPVRKRKRVHNCRNLCSLMIGRSLNERLT